jgi:transitional endoplasmic reticulum ATPase
MAHATTLCRRRWARRARGLADFAFGFALAGLSHVLTGLYRAAKWTGNRLVAAIRNRRQGSGRSDPAGVRSTDALRHEVHARREQYRDTTPAFAPIPEKPGVRFSDVAGLEDAKREIMLQMVLPLQYPEQAKRFGIRRGGGLLLYGPPGTGKTLLAKAVATEVDASFFHIRPSDIISAQVGQAEKNVCRLFQILRQEKRAVLFIDEIEALVPSRRRNGSTIMQRVISQFLGEVDGLGSTSDDHVLLLIGATNEPDMIDPAMMRPGRFDATIYVGLPDSAAREQMLRLCLVGCPVSADVAMTKLVQATKGKTGAALRNFVHQEGDQAFLRSISARGCGREPCMSMADFTGADGGPLLTTGREGMQRPRSDPIGAAGCGVTATQPFPGWML